MAIKLLVLDFGEHITHHIKDLLDSLKVKTVIRSYKITAVEIKALCVDGIIFSGGPTSVIEPGGQEVDGCIYELGLPMLGLCYGMQRILKDFGGTIEHRPIEEGMSQFMQVGASPLFKDLPADFHCWMNHRDQVVALPAGFITIGKTALCPIAAAAHLTFPIYTIQFHPEKCATSYGIQILKNFIEATIRK